METHYSGAYKWLYKGEGNLIELFRLCDIVSLPQTEPRIAAIYPSAPFLN